MRNEHLVYYSIGLQILIFHNSWIANPAEQVMRGHKVTAIVRNMESAKVKNPLIEYVAADATDPAELVKIAKGKDAVVSAYNPGWANPRQYEDTLENYPKIVEGAKQAGVHRLLIVGGAGTLFVKPGVRLSIPAHCPPSGCQA